MNIVLVCHSHRFSLILDSKKHTSAKLSAGFTFISKDPPRSENPSECDGDSRGHESEGHRLKHQPSADLYIHILQPKEARNQTQSGLLVPVLLIQTSSLWLSHIMLGPSIQMYIWKKKYKL